MAVRLAVADSGREALLYGDGAPLAGLEAVSPVDAPLDRAFDDTPLPSGLFRLSRFALMRRAGETLLLECPLGRYRIHLYAAEASRLFLALAFPVALEDAVVQGLPADAARILVRWLLLMRALEAENAEENADLAHWEFHDLLFHAQSRPGRRTGRIRPYRWRGRFQPLPLVKPAMGETVPLPTPGGLPPRSFQNVLASRRSRRLFARAPLPLDTLSAFLHHACRIQKQRDDELGGVSFRPSPSAGALHGLEVYLLATRCVDLPRALYRYDPAGHTLERLAPNPDASAWEHGLDTLEEQARRMAASSRIPAAYFVLTARFRRYQWKYAQLAYSVMLKDLGCLHQTMSLTAEALALASVILGDTPTEPFQTLTALPWLHESPVGSFSLGWPE